MSKEITKAVILQEIQDKLALREFLPETFLFSETVHPVYNIEPHLMRQEVTLAEKSITSGPTGFIFFTVPDNEKWYLRAYNIIFMAAGAYTVTGLYLNRDPGDIYLDMKEGQTVSYAVVLAAPIPLDPKDEIFVYVDSYTSTANLRLYIDYTREEVR